MAVSRGSKVFLVILLLGVALVGGGLAYASHLLGGDAEPGPEVELRIAGSAASIGERLEEEGVIRSALAFRLVARSRELDGGFLAGDYVFKVGMSVDDALDVLEAGPAAAETIRFTVPEGWTVAQTLDRLASATEFEVADFQAVLDAGRCAEGETPGQDCGLRLPNWVPDFATFGPEVRTPYEGVLFPETYEVQREASPQQILQRMVDQLVKVTDAAVEETGNAGADLYTVLIKASMIERETRVDDERPIVASVIENRLAIPMRLQIDATAIYASGKHTTRVLREDTEIQSPYNTYQADGLPPTPIAAPGRASITAALAPAETEFLYYVVDATEGCNSVRHTFARTLEEHNRNVAVYRQCQ